MPRSRRVASPPRSSTTTMHGVLLDTSVPATGPGGLPWPAVIGVILTLLYITVVRPIQQKKKKADPLSRPAGNQNLLAQQRAIERDMTALLVEYEQMMRTMSAQIETRVAKLEALLAEADERITRMNGSRVDEAATALAKALNAPTESPSEKLRPLLPGGGSKPLPASAEDSGAGFEVPAERSPRFEPLTQSEPPPAEAAPAKPAAREPVSPTHAAVYDLADEGLDARQIARKLNRPYGEVELILALRV